MINQLEGVFAPHPPHIFKEFSPLIPGYENLENDRNFYKLVSDICEFISLNPVAWTDPVLDPDMIIAHSEGRTLFHVFKSVYELNAIRHNARFWFCKSMQNVHFIEEFRKNGHHPYYIHLIRDGRDVALSFKKAIVGEKHIYHLARKWKTDQDCSRRYITEFGRDRAIQIRYEDLLISPEKEISKICKLIGLEYSDRIFDYYHSQESLLTASSGEMWQNLKRPIIKNNYGKYKKELSKEEIGIFEIVAGDILLKSGYDLFLDYNNREGDFSDEEIHQFNLNNSKMKLEMIDRTKNSDLKKRVKQELLIKEIKSRRGTPL